MNRDALHKTNALRVARDLRESAEALLWNSALHGVDLAQMVDESGERSVEDDLHDVELSRAWFLSGTRAQPRCSLELAVALAPDAATKSLAFYEWASDGCKITCGRPRGARDPRPCT